MSGNKDLRRAKHEAYQKKQAAKGEKVIKWIFKSNQVDIYRIDSPWYAIRFLCNKISIKQ